MTSSIFVVFHWKDISLLWVFFFTSPTEQPPASILLRLCCSALTPPLLSGWRLMAALCPCEDNITRQYKRGKMLNAFSAFGDVDGKWSLFISPLLCSLSNDIQETNQASGSKHRLINTLEWKCVCECEDRFICVWAVCLEQQVLQCKRPY